MAALLLMMIGAGAVAQQAPEAALAQDAAEYATAHGVSLDIAVQRLVAQEESVAATDAIRARFADRLAGIAIEHEPVWRIVVLLTGTDPVADETVRAGGLSVPIHYRTGAAATRAQLVTAIALYQTQIRNMLSRPPAMGVDPRTGELVVMVGEGDAGFYAPGELRARLAALTGVPVRIARLDDVAANLSAEGGARLVGVDPADGRRYACTTGFVVTDGARSGVVTAAHCPDALSYVEPDRSETPLEFAGQWGWGYQDVQVHVSAQPLAARFFSDTAKTLTRTVTASRSRDATRAGDTVCHRGERTGYSCATVELVDFAPAGDLCGGGCTPTWVAVRGPTCRSGDSGGPVFLGTTAFGIVKGGSYRGDGTCTLYYYMALDYLPPGWALLRAPAEGSRTLADSMGVAIPAELPRPLPPGTP